MPQSKRPRANTATDTKTGPLAGQVIGQEAETAHGEIVHVPQDTPATIYVAMDQLDEEQIVAEIMGAHSQLVDALVYEFEAGSGDQKKKVRGLSYTGVNWCVREMAKRGLGRLGIARNPVTGEPAVMMAETADPDGEPVYEVIVVAIDQALGTENAGMADSPLYPKKRGGGVYTDPHAKRKALSKAQRNAKQGLIPEELKAELMASVKGAQIKRVQTPRQQAEGAAGAKASERARGATATPPKRVTPASAAQQRMLAAKAREHGVDPSSDVFHALIAWTGGSAHLDRVDKAKVNAVVDALADADGTLDMINRAAQEGNEAAK